ncbi:MAG: hypothetical protein ACK4VY_02330 [Brevundimonas sp.]
MARAPRHLLIPQIDRQKLHPQFLELVGSRKLRSARFMLQQAFERMPVRDGGFAKDFQSTEFNTRLFELFVSELLQENGAGFTVTGTQPDFEAAVDGFDFTLECVTVNPTKVDGKAPAYRQTNPRDADMADLRNRVINDIPTRFGGALFSKRDRRFTKDRLAYWELPHSRDKPFLFAVQTMHEDGALDFSGSALATYLYGEVSTPAWDDAGNLIIKQQKARDHIKPNGEPIPSAFFDYEGTEHISGVLWSNNGTVEKFLRMAFEGPFPDDDIVAFRVGTESDPDPNAHVPQTFAYHVGAGPGGETWGEGCILFHNPNALHPLPLDLLKTVVNAHIDQAGRYVENIPAGPHPFHSKTLVAQGPAEIAAAERRIALYLEAMRFDTPEAIDCSKAWWGGFCGEGPEKTYRSDSLESDADSPGSGDGHRCP